MPGGQKGFEIKPVSARVYKDLKIQFDTGGLKKSRAFSIWLNTDFIHDNHVKLEKEEIDKVNKDKKCKNFYLEVFFEPIDNDENDTEDDSKKEDPQAAIAEMSPERIVILALKLQDNIVVTCCFLSFFCGKEPFLFA